MCICLDITAVQDYEMHYMNAWLKRCVFNLDLNRESIYIYIFVYIIRIVVFVNFQTQTVQSIYIYLT